MEHSFFDWSILALLTGPVVIVALEILARIEKGLDELPGGRDAEALRGRGSGEQEDPPGT